MNKTINSFLLTVNKCTPEFHLKQPGFTYTACELFTKHRERIQKFRETGNLNIYIELNSIKLVLLMMQHILAKRTVLDKILKDRAYGIAGIDGYQRALLSMV